MPVFKGLPADMSGLRVLITRPRHQAAPLVEQLNNAGAQTFELPCIDIIYRKPESLSATEIAQSHESDWWVFTSANAVVGTAKCGLFPPANPNIKIAAIGRATYKSLKKHNIPVDLVPVENSSSEQLLILLKQQISTGKKITIIRGNSGREILKESLQSSGIKVYHLEVYQRLLPDLTSGQAVHVFTDAMPCVISITSDLGLSHLLQLLPASIHQQLFGCPLVVNSERCAQLAKKTGFISRIIVANPPGDKGQILALSRF